MATRHIRIVLLILLTSVLTSRIAFGEAELFPRIEPFAGLRYGMAYDTAAQTAARGGQSCVDFDPKKIGKEQDGRQDNDSQQYSRSSDIVKQMNLSVDAQVKALTGTYEANATLDLANKTEVHKYSQTWLYRRYLRSDTTMLLTEAISLKPEYKPLFARGIEGLDEFRARCGNAFVVGQQTSAYYFGTAYKSIQTVTTSSDLNATFSFKYRGGVNADAASKLSIKELQQDKDERYEVKNSTSDLTLPPARSVEDLQKQFQEFKIAEGSVGKLVEARIAPYTVAKGVPPDSILGRSAEQDKMQIILNALWDLKTLKEQAQYILKKESRFALGLPNGQTRPKRREHVRSLLKGWQEEFDKLLKDLKDCMNSYNDNCTKLANTYEANPRIAQESLLPQKYQSLCYGRIEVRHDPGDSFDAERNKIPLQPGRRGDAEMGGGPVRLEASLDLMPDGRQLKATLEVRLEENKNDHSQFNTRFNFVVFDLNPPDFGDAFKECEFFHYPVSASRLTSPRGAPKPYGRINRVSGRDPRGYQTFRAEPGEGVLQGISCILDTEGNDRDKLSCKPPELANLYVLLVNKLDLEAEKWKAPAIPVKPFQPLRERGGVAPHPR